MSPPNNNNGNYPEPANRGFVIPNDNDPQSASVANTTPPVALTGDDAVSELMLHAVKLLTKNNTFFPSSFGINAGSNSRVFTDNFSEENILNTSLYNTVVAGDSDFVSGKINLDNLVNAFAKTNSEVYNALTYAFCGGQEGKFNARGSGQKEILKGKTGSSAISEFVTSVLRNIGPAGIGPGNRSNAQALSEISHPILGGQDPTTNKGYYSSVASGYRTKENKGRGAEQVYSSERHFTKVGVGADWTSDFAEVEAVAGHAQHVAAAAMLGQDTSGWIIESNALINFFGGIAREIQRNPLKAVKFETNNILFHLHNPNIVNADASPDSGHAGALANFFGITSARPDTDDRPIRGNVTSIYRKTGPSVLSLIPDFGAFRPGKGKFFNAVLPLVGGAALTFGEQLIPGTGRTIDSVGTDSIVGELLEATGLDAIAIGNTSEIRDKENLEPKTVIARIENPKHFKGIGENVSGLVTHNSNDRVLSSVGKNRWQLKNLPDHAILRPTGKHADKGKPYTTLSKIEPGQVKEMEDSLESEYVPFYFHDLRTNEIISFYAFLRTITESFTPQWTSEQYYGRVDNVQIYGGTTTRTINLSYTIVALNRVDFDIMWKKVNKLVTLVYPQFGEPIKTNDGDTIPFSEMMRGAPIIRLRLGDLFKSNFTNRGLDALISEKQNLNFDALLDDAAGKLASGLGAPSLEHFNASEEKSAAASAIDQIFIDFKQAQGKGLAGVLTDLSFDYNTATWETAKHHVTPQLIEVSLSFTAIHDIAPGLDVNGINRAPLYTPVKDAHQDTVFNNSTGRGSLDLSMRE